MRIDVSGVRLFFDVEGAKLVPDGPVMREKPTLLLLHGGPGMDHSSFKPAFSQFADIAQVIYIDHRGNGRSDRQPQEAWNLAQWGDDIYDFCRALEIERPIVMGQSFGGFVAMAYATRHPEHPGKLIFSSTAAQGQAHVERSIELFRRRGGEEIGAMARHALTVGYDDPEFVLRWVTEAMPFYNTKAAADPDARSRAVLSTRVLMDFLGPACEGLAFDMLADLATSNAPRSCSVARLTRSRRSSRRRTSRGRFRRSSCSSSVSRMPATAPFAMTRAPTTSSASSSCPEKCTTETQRSQRTLESNSAISVSPRLQSGSANARGEADGGANLLPLCGCGAMIRR